MTNPNFGRQMGPMWERFLKNNSGRCIIGCIPDRMRCMILRMFRSNPFELINMWKNMSIMDIHITHDIWVIGLNIFLIPWLSMVGIALLLLRRRCRRLVPIGLVLLWGIIPSIVVSSSSISLVVVGGPIIYVSF